MNSLLQMLFHIPYFRKVKDVIPRSIWLYIMICFHVWKFLRELMISLILIQVVYHMTTNVNDEPSTSIPMALQSLFYKLQHSESSVATKDLTRSFGWDIHDVHELNRVLCEKFEEKMKVQ